MILGRRGPLQSTFTTLELRELGELSDVDVVVDPADLATSPTRTPRRPAKLARANIKVLRDYAAGSQHEGNRRIVFRFRTSPIEIQGSERVESIVLGRNELLAEDGRVVAKDTGDRETLPAQLVVRAVGYRGVPVPACPSTTARGHHPASGRPDRRRANEYVVGWIKRGPSGVIGRTRRTPRTPSRRCLPIWPVPPCARSAPITATRWSSGWPNGSRTW